MTEETKSNEVEVKQATQGIARKSVRPKIFFAQDEKIECVVTGYYSKETGMLEFCLPEKQEETEHFTTFEHKFIFSRVPYDALNRYREQSVVYNPETKTNSVNILKLRDYLWVFHLVDWNYSDEDEKKIELKHDPNGTLSDESLDLLYQIPASVLDTAIGMFERKINIA